MNNPIREAEDLGNSSGRWAHHRFKRPSGRGSASNCAGDARVVAPLPETKRLCLYPQPLCHTTKDGTIVPFSSLSTKPNVPTRRAAACRSGDRNTAGHEVDAAPCEPHGRLHWVRKSSVHPVANGYSARPGRLHAATRSGGRRGGSCEPAPRQTSARPASRARLGALFPFAQFSESLRPAAMQACYPAATLCKPPAYVRMLKTARTTTNNMNSNFKRAST